MNNISEQANLNPKYTFDTFVVGGNPIEDIQSVMDCRMTVIGGKVKFAK